MRVAVIFFPARGPDGLSAIAKSLARGIERQGNQVDVFDGTRDSNVKLTIYRYVAIGTEAVSAFGGKILSSIGPYLASSGMVSGKRSYAFVTKKTFGAAKALARLMRCMEGEGMLLKNSDILRSPTEAEEIGKRLHVS